MRREQCAIGGCGGTSSRFSRKPGVRLGSEWFCSYECLEQALAPELRTLALDGVRSRPSEQSLRPTLGLILLQQGQINKEQLEKALAEQAADRSSRIGEILRRLGLVTERDVTRALSQQYGLPWVNFVKGEITEQALRYVPAVVARAYRAIPVDYREDERRLFVAIEAPPDRPFLHGLARMLDVELSALVADRTSLEELLERFYPEERARGRLVTMRTLDWSAIAALVATNASTYAAEAVKLERLGARIWVRLLKGKRRTDFLVETDPVLAKAVSFA